MVIWQQEKSTGERASAALTRRELHHYLESGFPCCLLHQVCPPGTGGSSWPQQRGEAVQLSTPVKVLR